MSIDRMYRMNIRLIDYMLIDKSSIGSKKYVIERICSYVILSEKGIMNSRYRDMVTNEQRQSRSEESITKIMYKEMVTCEQETW